MSVQLGLDGIEAAPQLTDGLFFAVFPDASAAAAISQQALRVQRAYRVSGRLLESHRLHVTLLGLGRHAHLPVGLVTFAKMIGSAVRCGSFDLEFDRVTGFGASGHQSLMVLRGTHGLSGVKRLQSMMFDSVRSVLALRGVRAAFEPHVTLLYGEEYMPDVAIEPIQWHVTEFVLVHSLLGKKQHLPLARWSLTS